MGEGEARLVEDGVIYVIQAISRESAPLSMEAERNAIDEVVDHGRFPIRSLSQLSYQSTCDRVRDDKRPISVIHFSGHGTSDGKFEFCKAGGGREYVEISKLDDWFAGLVKDRSLSCVFFSACFAAGFLAGVAKRVAYVVSSDGEVGDEFARKFSRSFYANLCGENGSRSVEEAFDRAAGQLKPTGRTGVFELFVNGESKRRIGDERELERRSGSGNQVELEAVALFEDRPGLFDALRAERRRDASSPEALVESLGQYDSLLQLTDWFVLAMRDVGASPHEYRVGLRKLYELLAPRIAARCQFCANPDALTWLSSIELRAAADTKRALAYQAEDSDCSLNEEGYVELGTTFGVDGNHPAGGATVKDRYNSAIRALHKSITSDGPLSLNVTRAVVRQVAKILGYQAKHQGIDKSTHFYFINEAECSFARELIALLVRDLEALRVYVSNSATPSDDEIDFQTALWCLYGGSRENR